MVIFHVKSQAYFFVSSNIINVLAKQRAMVKQSCLQKENADLLQSYGFCSTYQHNITACSVIYTGVKIDWCAFVPELFTKYDTRMIQF
jgi:hypothetical protein